MHVYKENENKVIAIFTNQLDWEYNTIAELYRSAWQKTMQNLKSLFLRYFYFFQITDTQASLILKKIKISSKRTLFVKIDSFMPGTI